MLTVNNLLLYPALISIKSLMAVTKKAPAFPKSAHPVSRTAVRAVRENDHALATFQPA